MEFLLALFFFLAAYALFYVMLYRRLKALIISLFDGLKPQLEETVKAALHDYLGLNR